MDFDDALRDFAKAVDIPDPALDQALAAMREVVKELGIGDLTGREARVALAVLTLYLQAPEETKPIISAYLGTLLDS